MNNQPLVGRSCSESGNIAPRIQTNSPLREQIETILGTLGEALSSIRSIDGKLFMPVKCNTSNDKIEGTDTSNIESLICLIESITAKIEIEARGINSRI